MATTKMMQGEDREPVQLVDNTNTASESPKDGKKSVLKKAKDKVKKIGSKLRKPKSQDEKREIVDGSNEDDDDEEEEEVSRREVDPKDTQVPLDEYALMKQKDSENREDKLTEGLPGQVIAEQAPQVFEADAPPGILQAVPTEYHYKEQPEGPNEEATKPEDGLKTDQVVKVEDVTEELGEKSPDSKLEDLNRQPSGELEHQEESGGLEPKESSGEVGHRKETSGEVGHRKETSGELGHPKETSGELGHPEEHPREFEDLKETLGHSEEHSCELEGRKETSGELGHSEEDSREVEDPKETSGELGHPEEHFRELEDPKETSGEFGHPEEHSRELEDPKETSGELGHPEEHSRELEDPKDKYGQDLPGQNDQDMQEATSGFQGTVLGEKPHEVVENIEREQESEKHDEPTTGDQNQGEVLERGYKGSAPENIQEQPQGRDSPENAKRAEREEIFEDAKPNAVGDMLGEHMQQAVDKAEDDKSAAMIQDNKEDNPTTEVADDKSDQKVEGSETGNYTQEDQTSATQKLMDTALGFKDTITSKLGLSTDHRDEEMAKAERDKFIDDKATEMLQG